MPLFDNISQNQLLFAGLGLLGDNRNDPFGAALGGLFAAGELDDRQADRKAREAAAKAAQARQQAFQAVLARASGGGLPRGAQNTANTLRGTNLGAPAGGSFLQGTINRINQRNQGNQGIVPMQPNVPQSLRIDQPNKLLQDIIRRRVDQGAPAATAGQFPTESIARTMPASGATGGPTQLYPPQASATGQQTQAGRPIYAAPGGQQFSERSITVTHPSINGGQPTNIPSVFGGQVLSEQEAISRVAAAGGKDPETGRQLPSFGSIPEAVAAAKARSDGLGPQNTQPGFSITPQQAQLLALLPPEEGAQALLEMMAPASQKPTPLMQNVAAMGFKPGTPEYHAAMRAQLNKDDPTSLMQNLAAAGLQPGTPEYSKAILDAMNRPGTTVNVGPQGVDYGDPPKGMAWARNQDGSIALQQDQQSGFSQPVAVPISGGPVEEEQRAQAAAGEVRKQAETQSADIVLEEIGRIRALDESSFFPTTGIVGGALSNVPGTGAFNTSKLLDTLKAITGFSQLQKMRDASPTGGALGQVSERENNLLQSVLGNLEQAQEKEQFFTTLDRLEGIYTKIVHGGLEEKDYEEPTLYYNPATGDFQATPP